MDRSFLFVPGTRPDMMSKAIASDADAVIMDLEDSVPPDLKARAREHVARHAAVRRCWVRVNAPYTDECERDLAAVGGTARGIRIPKVESSADVAWVRDRAPGKPLICAVETARGVLAAVDVAQAEGVTRLALGGVDLRRDIRSDGAATSTIYARSHLVMASRAAGLDPPIDSVFGHLDDQAGLQAEAEFAKSLGFFGKSAIHPAQLPVIHSVFTPTAEDLEWADQVLSAFEESGGAATKLATGEFVDRPVVDRANDLLRRGRGADSSRV
ncbi:MAG TPA: CoA ester lyase [Nocardioides sp.]|nr:CoA ester lyase [Nocardioides sp.]